MLKEKCYNKNIYAITWSVGNRSAGAGAPTAANAMDLILLIPGGCFIV
jgi:hypothetical protein